MPISSVTDARFDHVDEDGELVFVSKGLKFRIPVDDTLEHAILEARQILSETDEASNPGMAQTLPISSIQALIRAGAQPEKVAKKYGLSQALVRRFSAPVETEKQYAIEQFLAVSAPKGSKVHSVEELIARTLAAARIGMESVKWGATRRGREPWLITATFSTQRNRIRAEWSWNMHDNTVECQNAAAQILLGERDTTRQSDQTDNETQNTNARNDNSDQSPETLNGVAKATDETTTRGNEDEAIADSAFTTSPALPGDSVRSARIASTVASMQEQNDDGAETYPANSAYSENKQDNPSRTGSVSLPYPAPTVSPQPSPVKATTQDSPKAATTTADTFSLPLPGRTRTAQPQTFTAFGDEPKAQADNNRSGIAGNVNGQQNNQTSNDNQNHDEHRHGKRKSGRSAVPSWDEILFGE